MFQQSLMVLGLVSVALISERVFVKASDCVKRPKVRSRYCKDSNEARKGHTMCLGGIKQTLVTKTDRTLLQDLHNDLRANVFPPAANMMIMQYSQPLEKEAQIWAEQCKMSHDQPDLRFLPGRYAVGQNIARSSVYNWTSVFQQWKGENGSFTYGGPNNATDVKNLVQMITAETSLLGCGASKCGSEYFFVCNYGPVTYDSDANKPYIESNKWCESCPKTCDNVTSHLCDCDGKFCVNGGILDLQTCACNCIKEVKAYKNHEHCELQCGSHVDDARCNKAPYVKSSCRTNITTAFHCPWMCDICPYAGMNYTGEGITLLPWEKGLPYCPNATVPNNTIPNSSSTKTDAQRNKGSCPIGMQVTTGFGVALVFLLFAA